MERQWGNVDRSHIFFFQIHMMTENMNNKTFEKNLKWLPLSMRRDMHTINLTFKCNFNFNFNFNFIS